MAREFTTIGVIGLGTMGAGIAEVFARNGFDVVGVEQSDELLERGRGHVQSSTDRAVRRGRLAVDEQQAVFERLTLTSSMSDLKDCDLVVEAVLERLDLKLGIFRQLDDIVRPDAVLATNTSSLSVTEIAAATARPGRVVGMHFFNPAPVQRLVEVVHTVVTEPGLVDDVQALAIRLGKNPVVVADRAGFIANALLFGYLNHAVAMFESRHATREDLDAAMTVGCGYPLGPLALLDLIGLDTSYEILQTMYAETRDRLHAPAPLLKHLVTAGLLGRKSGRGFYTYDAPHSPKVAPDQLTPSEVSPSPRRPIRRVGIVGSGRAADGVVEAFVDGPYDVTRAGASESLAAIADAELVLVATEEDADASTTARVFERLGAACGGDVILATTTAGSPLMALAAASGRPSDVVGLHFVEGASGGLVEVVSTVVTSADVAETAAAMCLAIGRRPISCGDRAGYVVDALLFPYLNDAVRMVEARYATKDDVDTAMTQGCALPKGPFAQLDEIGAEAVRTVLRRVYDESREPGHAPAPLLEQWVAAGRHLPR